MHDIPMSAHKRPEYFLEQSKQLKKLITGGSAIMVIGIIHMQLWLNWPLSFVEETQEIDQLQTVTLIVCQYWGVCYSLIMAALYLPAAAYLSDQAKMALLQGSDEGLKKDPSSWLLENNMMFSPVASLPQIIAVFALMLAGSFGTTLSSFVFY